MTNRDGRKATAVELPIETREALKEQDVPMWKSIDEAVKLALGLDEGSTEAALERRLEEIDSEIDSHREVIEEKEQRVEDLLETRSDLSDKLEQIRQKKQSYKEQLDTVLEEMLEDKSKNVLAWMSEIRDASVEEYGRDTDSNIERVIADLRKRRDERALAIQDHRFQRAGGTGAAGTATASTDGGEDHSFNANVDQVLEDMEADD